MKPIDKSLFCRQVTINLVLSSLFLVVLSPDTALAHGEQIGIFINSLGFFVLLSILIIALVKLKWRVKGLFFLIYILLIAILLLTPGTRLLPVTHPITEFIEGLIWNYPKATAFTLNLLGLFPWFIFLIHQKIKRKKQ